MAKNFALYDKVVGFKLDDVSKNKPTEFEIFFI